MSNGLLVSFEGIDGSGKTTQVRRFSDYLISLGHHVSVFREPGGTSIGERIRGILLDNGSAGMVHETELFLYLAARAQITSQVVRPLLDSGNIVVMDRFIDSTTSYQGYARGLDIHEIGRMNKFATGGLLPDITFYIDCPPDVAALRMSSALDRLESEGITFMERVRSGFLEIAKVNPSRITVVDGTLSEEDVFTEVKNHFEGRFNLS